MMPTQELSEALKRKRNKIGETQQRISDLSSLSVAQISRIENNDTNYSHENAYKLWKTLKQLEEDLETVEEVMKPSISWAKPKDSVLEVKKEMREENYSQLPVKEEGEHIGRINSTILLNANSPDEKIENYVGPAYSVVGPGTPASSIQKIVKEDSAILVKENGEYQGLVTRADIL
jgi:predicted transcriptional regulator